LYTYIIELSYINVAVGVSVTVFDAVLLVIGWAGLLHVVVQSIDTDPELCRGKDDGKNGGYESHYNLYECVIL